jgi:hypothetical protein
MFLPDDGFSPLVTFSYVQGQDTTLAQFVRHLEMYLPLFRELTEFRFLYLAQFDSHFEKAQELFNSLVTIPLGSDISEELLRYFQIRKAWDLSRYTSLTEADLIFRNQAKARFKEQRFEHLYRGWKAGRVPDNEIRQQFSGRTRPVAVRFEAERICPVTVAAGKPKENT